MVIVIYLGISTHEIHSRMISEYGSVTVIPSAIKVYKIPIMSVVDDRRSLDHHVRDTSTIQKHFRARIENIAVAVTSRETSVSSSLIRLMVQNRLVVNVRVNPVKNSPGSLNITPPPEA